MADKTIRSSVWQNQFLGQFHLHHPQVTMASMALCLPYQNERLAALCSSVRDLGAETLGKRCERLAKTWYNIIDFDPTIFDLPFKKNRSIKHFMTYFRDFFTEKCSGNQTMGLSQQVSKMGRAGPFLHDWPFFDMVIFQTKLSKLSKFLVYQSNVSIFRNQQRITQNLQTLQEVAPWPRFPGELKGQKGQNDQFPPLRLTFTNGSLGWSKPAAFKKKRVRVFVGVCFLVSFVHWIM